MGERDDRRPPHPPASASGLGNRADRRRGGVLPGWLYLTVGVVLLVVTIALWRGNVAPPTDAGTLPVTVTVQEVVPPPLSGISAAPPASPSYQASLRTSRSSRAGTVMPRPTPLTTVSTRASTSATGSSPPAAASTAGSTPNGAAAVVPGVPATLELPGLGVTAAVDPVVSIKGILQVPEDISRVGWWRYSAPAGASTGTTVIDGHIDSATAGEGALFNLAEVSPGDTVTVRTTTGARLTYRVDARKVYVKSEGLPAELFAQDGPGRLVIISCGGSFDPAQRSYRDNIAVFATVEGSS